MKFTKLYFVGGVLCIDFINTFDHRNRPPEFDFLPDRKTFLEWGRARGSLPRRDLAAAAAGGASMTRVRRVREGIYRVLEPFARSQSPSGADLAAFNELLRETAGKLELIASAGGYRLECPSGDPAERILCGAVRSAAELLLSNRPERIRQCPGCGWLFYDATRNRSRRWCTMKICGNRAKARRHYQKVRRTK
jgi:predicted RNA-binding Zn ribbon-like protein